jgi:hypothetical protein
MRVNFGVQYRNGEGLGGVGVDVNLISVTWRGFKSRLSGVKFRTVNCGSDCTTSPQIHFRQPGGF